MVPWQDKIVSFVTNEREKLVGYVRRFIDDTAERDGEVGNGPQNQEI